MISITQMYINYFESLLVFELAVFSAAGGYYGNKFIYLGHRTVNPSTTK